MDQGQGPLAPATAGAADGRQEHAGRAIAAERTDLRNERVARAVGSRTHGYRAIRRVASTASTEAVAVAKAPQVMSIRVMWVGQTLSVA